MEAKKELAKMKEQEKLAQQRKEEMEAKVRAEREKQLRKLGTNRRMKKKN